MLEATTYLQRYMGSSDLSTICTYVLGLNIHWKKFRCKIVNFFIRKFSVYENFTTKKANYDDLVPRPHPLLRTKSGDPSQIYWANYWNVARTN